MKRILIGLALMASASAAAAEAAPIEGRWTNPKHNVIIHVQRCGAAYCGKVAWASEQAKAKARHGENLVGATLMSGFRPVGNGEYKGRAFDPKRGLHGTATIRPVGDNGLEVRGCAIAGMLCKSQRWTRVS
ncbi:MAG: DUF2147 domain-containing protein [Sphingomicrobium sp.]